MAISKATWRSRQVRLNTWTGYFLRNITPLRVDGVPGPATRRRISSVKYYQGLLGKRSGMWTWQFDWMLRNTNKTRAKVIGVEGVKRGQQRRAHQRAHAQSQWKYVRYPNVVWFDGRPCAKWLAVKLLKARAGRWRGGLNSGWRDPVYSEQLCYRMCGRPYCPGRCAGRSSNHAGSVYPAGAVDVSDYYTFASECRRLGLGIWNALGAQDPVHFSVSGR